MIGAGVLGLPAAMAPLGWGGGLIVLVATFWISWHTYALLVHMHEVPDIDNKTEEQVIRRLDRYQELTTHILGKDIVHSSPTLPELASMRGLGA